MNLPVLINGKPGSLAIDRSLPELTVKTKAGEVKITRRITARLHSRQVWVEGPGEFHALQSGGSLSNQELLEVIADWAKYRRNLPDTESGPDLPASAPPTRSEAIENRPTGPEAPEQIERGEIATTRENATLSESEDSHMTNRSEIRPNQQSAAPPRSVCGQCGTVYVDYAAFCSRCGSPTVPPDSEARITALEIQVQSLQQALREKPQPMRQSPFHWRSVSGSEKWSVTWGVWGRTILVNIMLFVGFIIILAAAGLIASQ